MGDAVIRIRRQLARAVEEHELARVKLANVREQVQTEIEIHELLISLGRNERLLRRLDELEENSSRTASLLSNGLTDEERNRLHIPAGVAFEAIPDAEGLAGLKMLVRHKTWVIEITWHRQNGIMVRPVEGHRGEAFALPSLQVSEKVRPLAAPEGDD